MKHDSKLNDIINNFSALDGKIIGEDMQKETLRVRKSEKEAVVSNVVDVYLKRGDMSDPKLVEAMNKYDVKFKDVIREAVKREIMEALRV